MYVHLTMGNPSDMMETFSSLRILLVDDHNLFLEGLTNLLASEGIQVVGSAHDGFEALNLACRLNPDIILMDVHMPRCDGVSATRLIKAERPEIKIVMLTMSEDDDDLFEAVRSGASGYLLKSLDADEFFEYLKDLQNGHPPFSPGLANRLLKAFSDQSMRPIDQTLENTGSAGTATCGEALTPRQIQIITLVAKGHTYRQIATILSITERTVKYHMGEILDCLHLENRAQVIAYAARSGLNRP